MKIGIIALGLIGGSLAKAIKTRNLADEVVCFNRNVRVLKVAKHQGFIDEYTTEIDETFSNCNIIFICTPVDKICDYAQMLAPFIDENTILTDVGSTKNNIFMQMAELENLSFIGGHPMTGSEKTGYDSAKEYLFENAYYVLTPQKNTKKEQYKMLEQLVKDMGAIPIKLDPANHDYIVAAISHVPHIIASALVNCVSKIDDDKKAMHLLAAGGFRDLTRIASSSADIWNSICIDNKSEVLKILDIFKKELDEFKILLENDDIYDFFETGKTYRDSFATTTKSEYLKYFELKVDVLDKPGIIATVATLLSANSINIKNIGIVNNRELENGILSISFENAEDMEKSKLILESTNYIVY